MAIKNWRPSWFIFLTLFLASVDAAPAATLAVQTIQFGEHRLRADIVQPTPAQSGPRPAMILIHGGGWSAGHRDEFSQFAQLLASRGILAMLIDYRLAGPDARWPAQAVDVASAVWYLRENARRLQIDTQRIGALGGSAGGHLAAWLATTDSINPNGTHSRVDLLISLWGPWDLTLSQPDLRGDARNMIRALLGAAEDKAASPLFSIDRHSAPALLIHGSDDTLVPPSQSRRACNALREAGVECRLLILEGENHSIQKPENAALVLDHIGRFIHEQFFSRPR
ncbi:MAG: alpha/beta hydrolase [Gammaproteobacteria bacterium]